jgi:dolichol-phosphate mannosyltransferase
MANIDCTIVIPVYFNQGSLRRTTACLQNDVLNANPHLRFEIIFVDDGSGDGSLQELLDIRQENPELVRIIKFTRNFGQVSAVMAGFAHAHGQCVVMMSADGQDPAALINDMLAAHLKGDYEIVVCTREGRDESAYRIWTSKIFYKLMRKLSFPNMPEGGFDFVLLGRRPLDVLLRHNEAHLFLQGQMLWTGFPIKFIGYQRRTREVGKSRWTLGKKLTYLIDGVLSYSFLPIRLASLAGFCLALLGFFYAVVVFAARVAWGHPVEGWTPLMIIVLVIGGVQLLMLGMIGEYVWRTLAQVRNRDRYIIDHIYE